MIMDPISDMLIRIKNASLVAKEIVLVPHSKIKQEIANLMKEKGYLSSVEVRGRKSRKVLELAPVYGADGEAKLHDIKKISKPSKRVYKKSAELRPIKKGFGFSIVSTSKGLKTDESARREKVGGEILCEIW
ncbi:30S ribosomal protein S8 [Candidatus Giovannonibacteria bacterium RIFCSPLOWO2_02_FULL_43_11b]|uniref:Small ribosomal subunit protein uS8 n=1 Tax=Candidatus Giovannonibacteria bacterium RIFCSPHIGHO2_12_FULL_43_15 TaxID=1798341 RepID=A0A1F5WR91_9BACT|nr:MAG: 30S ribosomal protein S8 [Candidatus Giovannonibacteria bacterium RIFCSPHIGHO2_01_FULL_43_100]OGF66959.1 MAG: 30S ribosomal protein S8 [Candidatus Giovannonibacteria bacterium RIFCSPHIGHO2_02_FULL_43_32]OGF78140.1 MAG: 30S ribosomal protein S8 [Candidatus Giovannonibacteria bacterium RIFCSPHIGHO2_12_FULL_43_15]OGF78547.1 MAG: 30S ribosomal protein S8 [Candidatus Giovannonibacteria bacterium RIFCSPLOWO2_01_FULL_43_60]OGF89872.1 MAG: 30S ribosomal protein S8 [Candidatus Giovannonibacteria